MKNNKYNYAKIIQQLYSSYYGWEDVSEYEANSTGKTKVSIKEDLKEYRLLGYPTRVILRRELAS